MPAEIGPYTIEAELARGGAGVVYRARSPDGDAVAIKLLVTHSAEPTARRRFDREVRVLSRLRHPNVVNVLDSGATQGRPYLVMDLVAGESLERRLSRGPLAADEAAALIASTARAAHYAHEAGLVHRDIKPGNVLLDEQGQPRLTDFGLVRDLDASLSGTRLSKTGFFLGTPAYWPPEQAEGDLERVGVRSDVYALGATLYAALTGVPPHQPRGLVEAIELARTRPAAPSTLAPEVPPALDAICLRCLEPQPERRFPSALALAEALDRFRSVGAEPPKSGAAALATVVIVLGGAVAALGIGVFRNSQPPAPPPATTAAATPDPTAPDPTDALLAEAWLAYERDAPAHRVEMAFRRVLELDPDSAAAKAGIGLSQVLAGNSEGVAQAREAAADSDSPQAVLGLALALALIDRAEAATLDRLALLAGDDDPQLLAWRAFLLNQLQDHSGARELAERAIRLDPTRANAWVQSAVAREDAVEALQDLEQAERLDRDLPSVWSNRAVLLQGLGRGAEAVESLQRALALAPHKHELRLALARLLLQLQRGAEAIETLEVSLLSTPRLESAEAWRLLGIAREQARDRDGAEQAFSRAVELEPQDLESRARLANSLLTSRPETALAEAEGVLAQRPAFHSARYVQALALQTLGRDDEARQALETLLAALPPGDDPALAERARGSLTQLDQGMTPAIADRLCREADRWVEFGDDADWPRVVYDRILAAFPDHGWARVSRAVLLAREGQLAQAFAEGQRGLQHAQGAGEDLPARWAYALIEANELSAAERTLKAALSRRPRANGLLRIQAILAERRGQPAEARRLLDLVIETGRGGHASAALMRRSILRAQSGDVPGAHEDVLAAVRLAPNKAVFRAHRAKLLRREGRLQAALDEANEAVTRQLDHPEVHRVRAAIRLAMDDLGSAEADARAAIRRGDPTGRGSYLLGQVQSARGDRAAAVASFHAAYDAGLRTRELLTQRADTLRLEAQPRQALADCAHALAIDPNDREAWLIRAACLGDLRRNLEAHHMLRVFLARPDLSPHDRQAAEGATAVIPREPTPDEFEDLVRRAERAAEFDPDTRWAAGAYRLILRADPEHPRALAGLAALMPDDRPRAQEQALRARALAPDDPVVQLETSALLALQGEVELAQFDATVQRFRDSPHALRRIGSRGPGTREQALDDLNRAVALAGPALAAAYAARSAAYAKGGDALRALEDIEQAILLEPDVPAFRIRQIMVLLPLRRWAEIEHSASLALIEEPLHVLALTHRAHARLQLDSLEGALSDARSAKRCGASGPLIAAILARTLTWLGRYPGALQALNDALGHENGAATVLLIERAEVHRALGDPRAALADADRALARVQKAALARLARAGALLDLGRRDEAQAAVESLRRDEPAQPLALQRLGALEVLLSQSD